MYSGTDCRKVQVDRGRTAGQVVICWILTGEAGIDPGAVTTKSVENKVAVGQVSVQALRVSPIISRHRYFAFTHIIWG